MEPMRSDGLQIVPLLLLVVPPSPDGGRILSLQALQVASEKRPLRQGSRAYLSGSGELLSGRHGPWRQPRPRGGHSRCSYLAGPSASIFSDKPPKIRVLATTAPFPTPAVSCLSRGRAREEHFTVGESRVPLHAMPGSTT